MIRFGPYRLDPVQGLRRGKQEIRLTPRSLAVLAVLAGQPGRVISKDELDTAREKPLRFASTALRREL